MTKITVGIFGRNYAKHPTRTEAMVAAHQTGAFHYAQIAKYFGDPLTTLLKAVRVAKGDKLVNGYNPMSTASPRITGATMIGLVFLIS